VNLRGFVNIAQGSLTSGTTYNLLVGAAPAQQRVAVTGFGIFGAYNAAATPGLLQFAKAASAGSGGTAVTPLPLEPECTETFQSTWATQPSSAPSSIVVFDSREVNPQLGLTEYFPLGDEIYIKGGGFFVIQFTPQVTCNYSGWIRINE
jgi:hypothetical protein